MSSEDHSGMYCILRKQEDLSLLQTFARKEVTEDDKNIWEPYTQMVGWCGSFLVKNWLMLMTSPHKLGYVTFI
eukprot:3382892-Ditylum_brightwellii.AAC.1